MDGVVFSSENGREQKHKNMKTEICKSAVDIIWKLSTDTQVVGKVE